MSNTKHPKLAHHFASMEQQYESASMGMWLFLITEIMLFGGFFLGYTVYRYWYPEAFAIASAHLNWVLGAINTVVLLSSSLTMVLAVHEARLGNKKKIVQYLLATFALGAVFFIIKGFEYQAKFAHHLVPGRHFEFHYFSGPGPEIFYSFYFGMTGLHAFHMLIGMVLLLVLAVRAHRGDFTKEHNTWVDMFGLYWHLVDVVWIFLFPLLYLI